MPQTPVGAFRTSPNGRFLYGRVQNYRLKDNMTSLPNYDYGLTSAAPLLGTAPLNVTFTVANAVAPVYGLPLPAKTELGGLATAPTSATPVLIYPEGTSGSALPAKAVNTATVHLYATGGTRNSVMRLTDQLGRIIDEVITVAVNPDVTGPSVSTYLPADEAVNVNASDNLRLVFGENVTKNSGIFRLYKTAGAVLTETINVTAGAVAITNATVDITRSVVLDPSTAYYMQASAGILKDASSNLYAGIANATTWNFTTVAGPAIASTVPVDNAVTANANTDLTIVFDKDVVDVAGDIVIYKTSDDSVVETIPVTDPAVTIVNDTVTIARGVTLDPLTGYYVNIAVDGFRDMLRNKYAGLTSETAWSFTTVVGPALASTVPVDDAIGVLTNAGLTIVFDKDISVYLGNIVIHKSSDDSVVETIDVNTVAVSITNDTVTVTRSVVLDGATEYYVNIDAGAFKDVNNNKYAGLTSKTAWSFTTA